MRLVSIIFPTKQQILHILPTFQRQNKEKSSVNTKIIFSIGEFEVKNEGMNFSR